MRVRLQGPLAHPGQEPPQGGSAPQVAPDHQGVDEEPDQVLHLGPRPPRDRGPHHHVVLPGVPRQERLEGRHEDHEERGPLAPGQPPQRGRRFGGEEQGAAVRTRPPRRRAGAVERELQDGGSPRQPPAPVRELRLQRLAPQPLSLPDRVVRVLHREDGEHGLAPLDLRRVQLGHVPHQHVARPPVAGDVVQGEEQHRVRLRHREHGDAQRRGRGQVERPRRLLARQPPDRLLPGLRREPPEVVHGGADRGGGEDHLLRAAVHGGEDGAQRLVARHERGERPPQRAQLRGAVEAQGVGHVVGDALRLQLLDHPQALLGEGERERAAAGDGDQRGRRRAAPRAQQGVHPRRQPGRRGGLEERPQRDLHPERLPRPRHQAGGDEGVPAQREEVVADPHPLPAERPGPDPHHDLLRRGARPGGLARGLRRPRLREGPPVHLAVGGQRKPVHRHEGARDHVLREPPAREGAQPGRVGDGSPLAGHHVGGQVPLLGRVAQRHHHGVHQRGVLQQGGLHLARLHAEAADLDLEVHPPHELQVPVGEPAPAVARAVHPRSREPGERVGEEALRRELRPPQVAARHAQPAM